MEAPLNHLQAMADAVHRVKAAGAADLPLDELTWLLPVDFLPHVTDLLGFPVRRAVGLDRAYLAHAPAGEHASTPLGDPTSADTAYDVTAAAMEKWVETYNQDFFPDGMRGAKSVVQALLDLGWRAPHQLADEDIALYVRDNGGPENGIVAVVDGVEKLFPLPKRRQTVSLAEIRAGMLL